MGKENIQACNFYRLTAIGLFFCFCQFFFHIAFSFTGRLRYISVFTKIFYDIVIVNNIIYQWQNGT